MRSVAYLLTYRFQILSGDTQLLRFLQFVSVVLHRAGLFCRQAAAS